MKSKLRFSDMKESYFDIKTGRSSEKTLEETSEGILERYFSTVFGTGDSNFSES